MTTPEVLLWNHVKNRQIGYLINRQYRIGPFISDFFCRSLKVVIEVDGKIHQLREYSDEQRDLWLGNEGYRILRLSARSVLADPHVASLRIQEFLDEVKRSRELES